MWYIDTLDKDEQTLFTQLKNRMGDFANTMRKAHSDASNYELLFQRRTSFREFMEHISNSRGLEMEENTVYDMRRAFNYNVIRRNCEAAKNQITSSQPKITFLTEDHDYTDIERAEKLSKHINDIFDEEDIYVKAPDAFIMACIMRLGILKLNQWNSLSLIHFTNFFCDNLTKGSKVPREAGNFTLISPYTLQSMFPERGEQIAQMYIAKDFVSDVRIYDLYRTNAHRCIFTDDMILEASEWRYNFVPYELFRWEGTTEGVLQRSISEELEDMHNEIENLLDITSISFDKVGIPKTYVSQGSKISEGSFEDNGVGDVIEYAGSVKPETEAPVPLHESYFRYVENLYLKSFETCGNNPTNITGELPPQLNQASGVAIQNYSDLDTKKFSDIRKAYEKTFAGLAKKILILGGNRVFQNDPILRDIDINFELKRLKIKGESMLPDTPGAQIQAIQAMIQTGMVGEEGWAMIKHPDIQKMLSSVADRFRAVDLIVEKAVRENTMPILFRELGVDVYLDRSRKIFATALRKNGSDFPPLVNLAIFIENLTKEVAMSQEMGIMGGQVVQ